MSVKRTAALLLVVLMLLSLTGCSDESSEVSPSDSSASVTEQGSQESSDVEAPSDSGELNVEQNLFDVEITIPASFYEEEMTQADLDDIAEESGFQSATLNEDGSVTYVMTHAQHDEMMRGIREGIDQSLSEMIDPEAYPSFVDVSANDDYTEFTVTVSTDEVGIAESISVIAFYFFGGMYHAFNGTEVDDITVTFVNADTGNVIETAHSSDMAE